ncbi:MAG: outer membrane beta-barrel protein [Balneolaceae bacterium]|nr:outer membrane beta-barrel protein [Balneolaceae bacterium]
MKKLLTFAFALLFITFSTSLFNNAEAQVEEGDFKAGIGLVFGTGIGGFGFDNDLGIRADGYYAVTPEIRAGGDFTFYFPDTMRESFGGESFETKLTVWELNLNGHYLFINEEDMNVYALGGINITGIRISSSGSTGFGDVSGSESDSEFGLNLGGGIEYSLDFADLFAEAKLGGLGGNANQFVLGAGLRFPF